MKFVDMKEKKDFMFSSSEFSLWKGNCLEEMNRLPDNSIDLVLADPPLWDHGMSMGCYCAFSTFVDAVKKSR